MHSARREPAHRPSPDLPSPGVKFDVDVEEAARGEAARAARRLEAARERIVAAREQGGAAGSDTAWGGFDDDVDDTLRSLLAPAVDRISRVTDLAAAMADGALSEESAEGAARAIAADQPHRRPR